MKIRSIHAVCLSLLSLAALVLFNGCAGSPIATSSLAERHNRAMVDLKPDMTPEEVKTLMGPPDKTEMYKGKNNEAILIYQYITTGKDLMSRQWNDGNYTPLIFENNKLAGWGWSYLNSSSQKYEFTIRHM